MEEDMSDKRTHSMTVFSRQVGEAIRLNDNILLRVLQVVGDSVELEITAPNDVPIYRGEDYAELKERLREGGEGGEE